MSTGRRNCRHGAGDEFAQRCSRGAGRCLGRLSAMLANYPLPRLLHLYGKPRCSASSRPAKVGNGFILLRCWRRPHSRQTRTGQRTQCLKQLAKRHRFDPDHAHAKYSELQPSLDLGVTSLTELCSALGIEQKVFEPHWLAIHPVDVEVIRTVERLLAKGHAVGLATNFCRRLLNLLIENTPPLSGLAVCCSSDIGLVKPSAEFFRRATEIMRSQEIVFIDDRGVNVEAARRFGWTSIQASEGWLARFRNTYFPAAQSC
jgi:HAD superfamily hydrolase (TIGR01509 family)